MPELQKNLKKVSTPQFRWLHTGEQALSEMLLAVESAQHSIRLEMYIFHVSEIAEKFHIALINACQRGVRVKPPRGPGERAHPLLAIGT